MTVAGPVHAFCDDALGDADATEVATMVAAGQVSAAEVCDAAVRRAEKMQPLVNGVEYPDYDRAMANPSGQVGDGSVFAGVPTFVKDNVDVAGMPTNHGTDAFVAGRARADGGFIAQYRALGLVLLGKSRLPEFGFSATTEYVHREPVRNPWNTAYSAGASSGGSAALVASGVVPIAHANDGGGSIRIPAAACGLVGLKPTRGRLVPDVLERRLPVPIATQGVLTRSVRDTARFYAGTETYWRHPKLPPVRWVQGASSTRLRIALVVDSVNGVPTDEQTRAAVLSTATLLAGLGHEVEEIANPVPQRFAEDFSLYWALLGLLVTSGGRRTFGREFDVGRTENLTRGLAQTCRQQLPRVPAMLLRLRRTVREYRRLFQTCDVLMSPVLCRTTPLIGELSPSLTFEELFPRLQAYVGFTPFNNACGGPAISVPIGQTPSGLPIGGHLSADIGDERTLLELAYEIEAAQPWPRVHQEKDSHRRG